MCVFVFICHFQRKVGKYTENLLKGALDFNDVCRSWL